MRYLKKLKVWNIRLLKLCLLTWCGLRLRNSLLDTRGLDSAKDLISITSPQEKGSRTDEFTRGGIMLKMLSMPTKSSDHEKLHHVKSNFALPLDKTFKNSVEPDGKTRRLPDRFVNDSLQSSLVNFNMILTPSVAECDFDVRLLVIVKSAFAHFSQRTAIRNTWGSKTDFHGCRVRIIFLLGKPGENETEYHNTLHLETAKHDDIVIGDFIDTYRNVTTKAMMGLKFFTDFCNRTEFLLSVDDDVYVKLSDIVLDHFNYFKHPASKVMQCGLQTVKYAKVARKGKWAVKNELYGRAFYPPYCIGPCYLMSSDVAMAIRYSSLWTPSDIPIDDAVVTGILREKVGLYLSSMRKGLCEHLGNPGNASEKLVRAWELEKESPKNSVEYLSNL